jgi:hypothetical protein
MRHAREQIDIGPILKRIGPFVGGTTQIAVAEGLGVRQSSISDAKRRGCIPDSWLVTLLRRFGLNPDWVMTGTGPQFLVGTNTDEVSIVPDLRVATSAALLRELGRRIGNRDGLEVRQ